MSLQAYAAKPGCPPLPAAEQREATASLSSSFFTITTLLDGLQTPGSPAKLLVLNSTGPEIKINMGLCTLQDCTHTLRDVGDRSHRFLTQAWASPWLEMEES